MIQFVGPDRPNTKKSKNLLLVTGTILGLGCIASAPLAQAGPTVTIDERYRYEHVDQANRPVKAGASTLRSRIGLIVPLTPFFTFVVEGENVAEVFDDNYNNTINRKVNHPVVADVDSTELNQGYIQLKPIDGVVLKGGRFVQTLDNHRFVGHVGWRQNNQTFDGATALVKAIPNTKIFYGYIGNVNRIFGDDHPTGNVQSASHLANIQYSGLPMIGTLTAYNYYLDLHDLAAVSSNSYGVSLKGKQPIAPGVTFKYYAEYARQTDIKENPFNYEADYYHIAPAISAFGLTVTGGYEVLGSDNGVRAFTTPLATLHKFNGFADQFLVTPNTGLEDLYVDVTYKVKGVEGPMSLLNGLLLKAQYHEFSADFGGRDYGTEFDAYAKYPLGHGFYVEGKYANYDADQFSVDVEKAIFGFGYKAKFDLGEASVDELK